MLDNRIVFNEMKSICNNLELILEDITDNKTVREGDGIAFSISTTYGVLCYGRVDRNVSKLMYLLEPSDYTLACSRSEDLYSAKKPLPIIVTMNPMINEGLVNSDVLLAGIHRVSDRRGYRPINPTGDRQFLWRTSDVIRCLYGCNDRFINIKNVAITRDEFTLGINLMFKGIPEMELTGDSNASFIVDVNGVVMTDKTSGVLICGQLSYYESKVELLSSALPELKSLKQFYLSTVPGVLVEVDHSNRFWSMKLTNTDLNAYPRLSDFDTETIKEIKRHLGVRTLLVKNLTIDGISVNDSEAIGELMIDEHSEKTLTIIDDSSLHLDEPLGTGFSDITVRVPNIVGDPKYLIDSSDLTTHVILETDNTSIIDSVATSIIKHVKFLNRIGHYYNNRHVTVVVRKFNHMLQSKFLRRDNVSLITSDIDTLINKLQPHKELMISPRNLYIDPTSKPQKTFNIKRVPHNLSALKIAGGTNGRFVLEKGVLHNIDHILDVGSGDSTVVIKDKLSEIGDLLELKLGHGTLMNLDMTCEDISNVRESITLDCTNTISGSLNGLSKGLKYLNIAETGGMLSLDVTEFKALREVNLTNARLTGVGNSLHDIKLKGRCDITGLKIKIRSIFHYDIVLPPSYKCIGLNEFVDDIKRQLKGGWCLLKVKVYTTDGGVLIDTTDKTKDYGLCESYDIED